MIILLPEAVTAKCYTEISAQEGKAVKPPRKRLTNTSTYFFLSAPLEAPKAAVNSRQFLIFKLCI
ncbi:MAG: hypothetical protein ABIR24_13980, partial [Verrucomicrobiota bacterium]